MCLNFRMTMKDANLVPGGGRGGEGQDGGVRQGEQGHPWRRWP